MDGLVVFVVLLVLGFILLVLVGSIAGLSASSRVGSLGQAIRRIEGKLESLKDRVDHLQTGMETLRRQGKGEEEPKPEAERHPIPTVEEKKEEERAPRPIVASSEPSVQKQKAAQPEREHEKAQGAAVPSWMRAKESVAAPEPAKASSIEPEQAPAPSFAEAYELRRQEWWQWFESNVGKQWLTWVGAVVLFLSAGFFVKFAFDRKFLGPTGRVVLGVVFGLLLIGGGVRFSLKRKMHALGQGLMGAGMAVLYVSLYGAFSYYKIMSLTTAFGLMILVTAGGMTLAVLLDAVAVSFLAVLGGFLTPILLSTGVDARDSFFTYVLLLDLGVLGVAAFKRWRALDVLAFTGTWLLYSGWFFKFYAPEAVAPTMLWLGAFYIVFLVQPFLYHLREMTPITGERFGMAVSNSVAFFAYAYYILHPEHNHVLGVISTGMSLCYLTLGEIARVRLRNDDRAVSSFMVLAMMFVTLSVPLHLDFYGVTIAWAVEGVVFVCLGYKFARLLPRLAGVLALALAAGRVFTVHWPYHTSVFALLCNKPFGSALFVALSGAAYALVHHANREHASPVDPVLKIGSAISTGLFAAAIVHVEVWQWLSLGDREPCTRWATALVWVAASAAYLGLGLKLRSLHSRVMGLMVLVVAAVLLIWQYSLDQPADDLVLLNGPYIAGLLTIAMVFAYAVVNRRAIRICSPGEQAASIPLYGAGIFLLVFLTSVETWQWLDEHHMQYIGRCVLTCLWVGGSAAYLFAGVKLRDMNLRSAGLLALIVAAVVAVISYGNEMDEGYLLVLNGRFIAGLAVAAAAFAHPFVRRRLPDLCEPEEKKALPYLYAVFVAFLFLLLSTETYLFFTTRIEDPSHARWVAQMALSIVWGLYASALLAVGFWRRLRPVRLSALGLFGVTALKLVLIDMARVEEVYRIISFFVLGLLMIAASYLYHRIEKEFEQS